METEGRGQISKKILAEFLSMKSAPVTFKCFENHIFDAEARTPIKLNREKEYYVLTGKEENLKKQFPDGIPGQECVIL